jgi:hypothetical protein
MMEEMQATSAADPVLGRWGMQRNAATGHGQPGCW